MTSLSKWQTVWIAVAACVCLIVSVSALRRRNAPTGPVTMTVAAPGSSLAQPGLVTPVAGPIYVHVTGQVSRPGLYRFPAGSRVMDAISNAGGAKSDADLDALNLATPLQDGQKLTVPALGEGAPLPPQNFLTDSPRPDAQIVLVNPEPLPTVSVPSISANAGGLSVSDVEAGAPRHPGGVQKFRKPGDGSLDINTAPALQLQRLPGVGPATAAKIVEYRESNDGFKSVDELMEVKGIGPAKLRKMEPFVTVGHSDG